MTLQGTEKQIAWAEQIRSKFLTQLDKELAFVREGEEELGESADGQRRIVSLTALRDAFDSAPKAQLASFWIEYRVAGLKHLGAQLLPVALRGGLR